jgi:3-phenylpropionate/trans-cinnamate dioxygenase ferredoxin reductase subunit
MRRSGRWATARATLNRQYGRHLRLESVDNAFEQGTTVALNLLGTPTPHDKVPWFWSDQFDLKLVIVGVSLGYDTVVCAGHRDAQLQRLLPARRRARRHRQHQRAARPDGGAR